MTAPRIPASRVVHSANEAWCGTLIDELVLQGLRYAVVCPGSRSTPLALALAERAEAGVTDGVVSIVVVVDERSAAFVALGLARSQGAPVLLLCTSGTAGAHFLPALIEAQLTQTPLIVITADRPPELHGFGALQSIDQTRLFGVFAFFVELGVPSTLPAALGHLRALAAQAMGRDGVTHLNAPFREPLSPVVEEGVAVETRAARPLVRGSARRSPDAAALADVAARLAKAQRPLLVVGPLNRREDAAAIVALARRHQVPVIAEIASQLRGHSHGDVVIVHGELLLRSGTLPRPDFVLRCGGAATTRTLQAFVDGVGSDNDAVFVVGDVDPNHRARIIDGDTGAVVEGLAGLAAIGGGDGADAAVPPSASAWLGAWRARDRVAETALRGLGDGPFDEPAIARTVVQSMTAGSTLMLASSMPIRDAETFGGHLKDDVAVVANRGACGIDGLISTAVGLQRASERPVTLLCGDLAFVHDLHGLIAARGRDLVVVVVNNDGGGIFSFLPVAGHARFEQLFGTPHGLSFEHAALLVSAQYARPTTAAALQATLQEARARGGLHVVELHTDRQTNKAAHERLYAAVTHALEAL